MTKPVDEKAVYNIARRIESAEARAEYLEQVCGDSPDVMQRVVELLRVHDEENSFLEAPPPILATSLPTLHQPISEKPGTVIGRYKLLEQIGEGGFGVVFMAEQTEPVRRKVALKIIKPGMDTKEVIARFEAERQALALMDHPNIAKVLDAGATESGRPYFVMELVKGVPVTEYSDKCNLATHERLSLFTDACQAVQHAHQKGIIHRDIKPSNVLVAIQDGCPTPKIIDFGVAKATNQRLTEQTVLTGFAQMVGTPLYMSPEQAEMSALDVDTRTDVYSLGVLLYELLTGTTPFEGDRFKTASYDEMRRIIREEEPAKPSDRISTLQQALSTVAEHRRTDPKRLLQSVRGDLDWIAMAALEKDRTRRYETVNAFAADVRRYLNDEPVEASPPSAAYRFKKFARRNKGLLTAVAIIAVVMLLGTAISTTQAIRATRAERAEAVEHEKADREWRRAEANLDLATAEQERAERNLDLALAALDAVYLDAIGEDKLLGEPPANPGNFNSEIRPSQPLTALERELLKRGLTFYDQFARQNAATPRAAAQTAQAYYRVALLQAGLGEDEPAEEAYKTAIERFEKLAHSDPENTAHLKGLAGAIMSLAKMQPEWKVSRRYLKQAEAAYSRAIAVDPKDHELYIKRGWRRKTINKYDEAAADFERAIELDESNVEYLVAAAVFYIHSRDDWKPNTPIAVQHAERAVTLAPTSERARDTAALVQAVLLNNRDAALKHVDAGLETTPDSTKLLCRRAQIHNQFGDQEAALRDAERALEIDPDYVEASIQRAVARLRIAQQTTDPDLARERLEQAFAEFETLQKKEPANGMLYYLAGHALMCLKRYDEAIIHLSEDIERRPSIANVRLWRAKAYFHTHDFAEALQDLQQARRLSPQVFWILTWIPPWQVAKCPDEDFKNGLLRLADEAVEKYPEARGKRLQLSLGLGAWDKALRDLEKLIASDTPDYYDRYRYALLCLLNNDEVAYRAACSKLLEHYAETDTALAASFAAWTCALHPNAIDDFGPAIELARAAFEQDGENAQFQGTLGGILYRAARHEEARNRLSALAIQLEEPDREAKSSPAYCWYVLAMAHKAAGEDKQAREYLAKANEWTDKVLSDEENPPAWNRRETLKLLREEAEGLVVGGNQEKNESEQEPEDEPKSNAETAQPASG